MRNLAVTILLLFFGFAALAQAQPHPQDSIILESKTVYPGAHPGGASDTAAYVYLKVYITNKDSLTAVALSLEELSLTGGAYLILGRPRTFNGVVSSYTSTLQGSKILNALNYHSNSPDSFSVVGLYDPLNPFSIEPANAARKPFWEIKFDSVWSNPGTVELDSTRVAGSPSGFASTALQDVRVHFAKSVVTVLPKGDLNLNGEVRPSDVILELRCVFLGDIPPAGFSACDLNCDGQATAADVAVFLTYKFLTLIWPC